MEVHKATEGEEHTTQSYLTLSNLIKPNRSGTVTKQPENFRSECWEKVYQRNILFKSRLERIQEIKSVKIPAPVGRGNPTPAECYWERESHFSLGLWPPMGCQSSGGWPACTYRQQYVDSEGLQSSWNEEGKGRSNRKGGSEEEV